MAARQTVTKVTTTKKVKRGIPAVIPNAPKSTSSGGKKRGRPKGSKDKHPRKKRS